MSLLGLCGGGAFLLHQLLLLLVLPPLLILQGVLSFESAKKECKKQRDLGAEGAEMDLNFISLWKRKIWFLHVGGLFGLIYHLC